MAKSSVGYFYQSITRIRAALSTSITDVAVSGSDDSDILTMAVWNTGSSTRTLTVYKYDGTNQDIIALISVPANTGYVLGSSPIRLIENNLLAGTISENTKIYFPLKSGDKIQMKQDAGTDLVVIGFQKNF